MTVRPLSGWVPDKRRKTVPLDGAHPHGKSWRSGPLDSTRLCLSRRPDPVTLGAALIFSVLLKPLSGCETLRDRVEQVLERLPSEVQRDFVDDPRFHIATENFVPGKGWTLWMPSPGPLEFSSRCVVLRRRLADRAEAFAHYVIAHEFAHAHLRNGGWGDITDIEEAADALAASWGFECPRDR